MTLRRFLLSTPLLKAVEGKLLIQGKEHRHMKASRVRSGDTIELFDMNGTFRKAVVLNTDKTGTEIQLLEEKNKKKHEQLKISLGVALPKGNRSDWLFEKITELGVSEIWPIESAHSILKLRRDLTLRQRRWERVIQQAAKQSLTPNIPLLHSPISFHDLMNNHFSAYDTIIWGCLPQTGVKIHSLQEIKKPRNALLLIGPEGDFSRQEKEMLERHKAIPVSLSFNRLRTETAAIVLVSAALIIWNNFSETEFSKT